MIFGRTPYHFAICVDDLDAEWLEISRRFDM